MRQIKETVKILGLGESLKGYKPDGCPTFGINDIYKYHKTNYLVCIHTPEQFNDPNRAEIIQNSTPDLFFCQFDNWKIKPFQKLNIVPCNNFDLLDSKTTTIHSNNTPFVAAVLAYKLGFKNIVLYGCDFITHEQIRIDSPIIVTSSQTYRGSKSLTDFKTLYDVLKSKGVNLYVSSKYSGLSHVLPIYNK